MAMELPLPPEEMRALVGPTDTAAFDNPNRALVYRDLAGVTGDVFDFGCGCGRLARQLIQQRPQPRSYVGVDLHAGMVRWCQTNLAPLAPQFRFEHHDIFNAGFNPRGKPPHANLPVGDASFDLVIAHSVFTHIVEDSAMHYLNECARILRPGGVLASTWFLFDKREFAMMQNFQNALYINLNDPTNAVIFDRKWLEEACLKVGFEAQKIEAPGLRGFHWMIQLRRVANPKPLDLPMDAAPLGSKPPPVPSTDPSSIG